MKTSILVILVCCCYLESIIGMELLLKMKYEEQQTSQNSNLLPEPTEQQLESSDDLSVKTRVLLAVLQKNRPTESSQLRQAEHAEEHSTTQNSELELNKQNASGKGNYPCTIV